MNWQKGTIEEFQGDPAKHAHHRKVRTAPGQPWAELHYLEVEKALDAGYTEEDLGQGKSLEFEGRPGPKGPVVVAVKPREAPASRRAPAAPAGEREFHNPYHFLPLVAPPQETLEPAGALLESCTFHDRFCPDRLGGRIVCRLTTEGPLVVGGRQEQPSDDPNGPKQVRPFTVLDPSQPDGRRPALPASTLRGLVSSLFEAATGSAMRVLPEREFTRRADYQKEFLSEIGMVRRCGGGLVLQPLTLSTEQMTSLCAAGKVPDPSRARMVLNGYGHDRVLGETAAFGFLRTAGLRSASTSHRGDYWYLRVKDAQPHRKEMRRRDGSIQLLACIGLDAPAGEVPIPHEEWMAKPEVERSSYTRGLLFVFGLNDSKAKNLPPEKKHEYFIPYSQAQETATNGFLPIPEEVLEDFERIAKSAAALPRGGDGGEDLPYVPAGRKQLSEEHGWRPEEGDLVYFKRDSKGNVEHLSFSSIWRRSVPGSLHGALRKVHPDLVPFDEQRQQLTLAEQVFGFVEQRSGKGEEGARALAGRVRFSHGLANSNEITRQDGWYLFPKARHLKILASPKPPSPALYFGHLGYVSKKDLSLEEHTPAGRKVYLHHRNPADPAAYCDQPEAAKRHLHLMARPIRPGVSFYFHIDFQNLSRTELGLLCFALRPSAEFRHKLGLGKPLGLGSVELEPLSVGFFHSARRYAADGLFEPKYAASTGDLSGCELEPLLAARYRHERAGAPASSEAEGFPSLEALLQEGRAWVRAKARPVAEALELIGDPSQVRAEVCYPKVTGQLGESEHFQWFVANETLARADTEVRQCARLPEPQFLHGLASAKLLPTLKELPPGAEVNDLIRRAKADRPRR
ncbi:MAG: TIGR03986 family CRISPR-associated RAMP protein [Thermoanaerobaculia bacterium]